VGAKKTPFFRVVVTEHREARDGAFVEILGHYYPRATPAKVELNRERVDYWLSKGARPSDTVRTLLAKLPAPVAAAAAAE
jgi:small subunit ribosomal protein S16